MARCLPIPSIAFAIVVLIVPFAFLEILAPAAFSQHDSEKTKAALKERDRLWDQSQKLHAAGKLAEATAAAEAALAIERKSLPADQDVLAVSLGRLAGLYLQREDFAAAKAARQEALEILRQRHGAAHWRVTDARLALEDVQRRAGMTHDQRQKLAEADRLNREVIARDRAGKSGEALKSARRALAIREEVLGERHPDYANSLNKLALLLKSQGDYARARPLYEQALAIRKEVLGERHSDYAQSLDNLAMLLSATGDYTGARPLLEQALAIRKEVLGECHPEYALSLNNLAFLLNAQGDYAGARPLYEQALAILKEVLGERHPDYAQSLNNLAMLLHEQGDYAGARPLYEKALAIRKAVLGERHSDYAQSLNNLALLLKSTGDYAGARPLYEQALAIRKAVLGKRHSDYAQSLNNLAMLLEATGDYTGARPLLEQALAIRKEVLGERHPLYALSLNNLAMLLQATGDYTGARPLLEQTLAIRKEVLGERHPEYALSLNNLAFLLNAQGDYAGATSLFEQALEISERNLDLAAAGQSERQQIAMARNLRRGLDAYLALAPLAKLSPGSAYRHVLAAKGAVFVRQRRMRTRRRMRPADPQSEAARRFADYDEAVARLATLALATPDPKQAAAWRDNVAGLSRLTDNLEAELARLDAGFRAARAEARRTPEQLQAALPRGTALVDMLAYTAFQPPAQGKGKFQRESRLVAFVVRPDRPIERIDLGPTAPIQKAINEWRPILTAGKVKLATGDPARELRRLIWEPLEPHLDGVASVLVSPDGPIGMIPLAALPGKEPGSYLIEERSIAVVPVPRVLGSDETGPAPSQRTDPGKAEPAPSLLLAGDINYGGDAGASADRGASRSAAVGTRAGFLPNFPRLSATGDEIASIGRDFRKRFRGADELELDGVDATEEALRREAPGIGSSTWRPTATSPPKDSDRHSGRMTRS